MNDPKAQSEPTMEEILASIRRIISEDTDGGAPPIAAAPLKAPEPKAPEAKASPPEPVKAEAPKPAPPPPPPPAPLRAEPPPPSEAAEPIELTQMIQDDGTVVDLTKSAPPPADDVDLVTEPARPSRDLTTNLDDPGYLVSGGVAASALSEFSQLNETISDSRAMRIGSGNRTIEELVKELLRPMLKEWLDANLAQIVQRAVEREVTRLAGRAESNSDQ
jgi:cell pole-organizing protein PopZ